MRPEIKMRIRDDDDMIYQLLRNHPFIWVLKFIII